MTIANPGHLIAGRRQYLSPSERAVADLVLADLRAIPSQTITELAARAGVSPPTITRFCRRLGFSSFQSFKLALAQIPPARLTDLSILDGPAAMEDE